MDVIGRCASKNDPRSFDFQLSTTFGRGVKEMVCIFGHDFWPKMTFTKKVIYEITKKTCKYKVPVLEELWCFGRNGQMRLEK